MWLGRVAGLAAILPLSQAFDPEVLGVRDEAVEILLRDFDLTVKHEEGGAGGEDHLID